MADQITPTQAVQYTKQAGRDFVERALKAARQIAESAQRGETRVVEQYLKNLESLDIEAERWWLASDG